jgi:hypothetical protein
MSDDAFFEYQAKLGNAGHSLNALQSRAVNGKCNVEPTASLIWHRVPNRKVSASL